MNLLRIIPSLNPRAGGPIEGARKIDLELSKRGHHVEVVCLDDPAHEFLGSYPARVHALGPSRLGYRYNPRLLSWLGRHHTRFDAVIVNGLWQYHGYAAWRALANTRTPYFVFTHGMLDPWFKRAYPLKHLKKWLYWPWAEYRVLRDAKAVLFTSEEERRLASDSFWLYRCNEVVTAYGTDHPPRDEQGVLASRFRERFPELKGKRVVLFLSRIHQKKGCDLLIEAFSRVLQRRPGLHLVVAGPDQVGWSGELQARARALGIEHRITWPGMLQGDDKWGAFHAADVFCLPSHQENFGIVVAEAMACGKPVLISNKVNIWREIKADGAGIVGDDTLQGVIGVLANWLNMTDAECETMRQAAVRCFQTRFRIDNVVTSLLDILSSRPGGSPMRGAP